MEEPSCETLAETKDQDTPSVSISTDQGLEAALQEAVRAEADHQLEGEEDMDIDDFYAPDPSQSGPKPSSHLAGHDVRSPEYSPQLDRSVPDAPDRESDDYEPPEATPPADEPDSPPFSPAPPQTVSSINQDSVDVDMSEINSTQKANQVEQNHTRENMPSENSILPILVEVTKHLLSVLVESKTNT